jgi:hypothetical protein
MCPVSHSDGLDSPGFLCELGPGLAACGEDLVLRREDIGRESVAAQIMPNVFDRIDFGRSGGGGSRVIFSGMSSLSVDCQPTCSRGALWRARF